MPPGTFWETLTAPVTVIAVVVIEPDGSVGSATIRTSSGYRSADNAVLRAVRLATYKPKSVNCQAVEGTYLWRSTFAPRQ